MSNKKHGTGIEWTHIPGFKGETWNPVTGCTKVSPGCTNCYAETLFNKRLSKNPKLKAYFGREFGDVEFHKERIDGSTVNQPLRWKKPRAIFVNSMSDLFHDAIDFEQILKIYAVMAASPQHIFIVLTKRPERAKEFYDWPVKPHSKTIPFPPWPVFSPWPLPNLWLGVTAENQEQADKRIPILLGIPTAKRFVSVEPMLGKVDIAEFFDQSGYGNCSECGKEYKADGDHSSGDLWYCDQCADNQGMAPIESVDLDWVICGGESGAKARPMHPEWVRYLKRDCEISSVPFFFKQWGEWKQTNPLGAFDKGIAGKKWFNFDNEYQMCRVGKKDAGSLLDGKEYKEYKEFPDLNQV